MELTLSSSKNSDSRESISIYVDFVYIGSKVYCRLEIASRNRRLFDSRFMVSATDSGLEVVAGFDRTNRR